MVQANTGTPLAPRVERVLEKARLICSLRGQKLTALRAATLAAIARSDRPVGAYALLALLERELGKKVAPPTVYRMLNFLLDLGVITRIESRHAYVLCEHPERADASIYFLCDRCEGSVAVENANLARLLEGDAATVGFRLGKPVIECGGTCDRCADPPSFSMPGNGGAK